MLIDFCLPIRNEEKILEFSANKLDEFLRSRTWPFAWRIILLVNGSSDRSAELARCLVAERPDSFKLLELAEGGKGLALKTWFVSSQADSLVFMDADLATSLDNLPQLLEPILNNQAEAVLGSRLLSGASTHRSQGRDLASRLYNLVSRLILGHQFSDLQCGFKAFRTDAFRNIAPFCEDKRWFFDTEWVMLLRQQGARVIEIPIDWQASRYQSRPSQVRVWSEGWRFLRRLLWLRRRLNKMKRVK